MNKNDRIYFMRHFIISLLIIGFDQFIKHLVKIKYITAMTIFPGIAIEPSMNKGIAFGLLWATETTGRVFNIALIVGMLVLLLVQIHVLRAMHRSTIGAWLIISGAISNLIDRIRFGGVIDFIKLYIGQYAWPTFNVADIAIVIGVGIIFWQLIRND